MNNIINNNAIRLNENRNMDKFQIDFGIYSGVWIDLAS